MTNHTPFPAAPSAWSRLTDAWSRASGHMLASALEANRATAAAFGLPTGDGDDAATGDLETPLAAMSYRRPDWTFERTVDTPDAISVGDRVTFSKAISEEDVRAFAAASGDTNRLHLDEAFARRTRFGGRIVHGTLISGLISAALARLPGLTIYLAQDLQFLHPVEIGERVSAVCEVVEDLGGDKYRLTTMVDGEDGTTIIDGEAVVLIDDMPDDASGQ